MFKIRLMAFVVLIAANIFPAAAQSDNVFAPERIGRWYMGGAIGGYKEQNNSQLSNQDGTAGFSISGGYRVAHNISVEVDTLFSHQDIDTPTTIPAPFVGALNSRADLVTSGVGGLVKLILPMGRAELYAGAGLGLYNTRLRVEGTVLNTFTEVREDDAGVGYQGLLGADFFVSRRISVGLEYRKFKLDADFGSLVPGKLDMGGDFFFATVRGHF